MSAELAACPKGKKGQGAYEKNTLSFHQKLRLVRFLEARRDKLLEERPPFAAVAIDAARELEIPVNEQNVRNAGKAAGVYWKARLAERAEHRTRGAGKAPKTRVVIAGLMKQIEMLRLALTSLYEAYGDPAPRGLTSGWPGPRPTPEDNGQPAEPPF